MQPLQDQEICSKNEIIAQFFRALCRANILRDSGTLTYLINKLEKEINISYVWNNQKKAT